MLESLQNDYEQLYSIFSPRTIQEVTKVAMKWWFIRTNNAEASQKLPCLSGWLGRNCRIIGVHPVMFLNKKSVRSSIEALLKRVNSGNPVSSINKLVDIYNSASLKYGLPCGAEDLDSFGLYL